MKRCNCSPKKWNRTWTNVHQIVVESLAEVMLWCHPPAGLNNFSAPVCSANANRKKPKKICSSWGRYSVESSSQAVSRTVWAKNADFCLCPAGFLPQASSVSVWPLAEYIVLFAKISVFVFCILSFFFFFFLCKCWLGSFPPCPLPHV